MKFNEVQYPDLADKVGVLDIYQTPYCFYYMSYRLLSVWIKKDRRHRYCLCASGYKKHFHTEYREIEEAGSYDVLYRSFRLEDTAKEFTRFIKNELFLEQQSELF